MRLCWIGWIFPHPFEVWLFGLDLRYNSNMRIIEEQINTEVYRSRMLDFYLSGRNIVSFDIETTGLYPGESKIMLAGLLRLTEDDMKAVQVFCDNLTEESKLIEYIHDYLRPNDILLTYNGKSFDVPFVDKRASQLGISRRFPGGLAAYYDLDLYPVIKYFSPLCEVLDSLSQPSIEIYLGHAGSRTDRINGYESVLLYNRYLTEREELLVPPILLHNRDDVVQLAGLLPVTAKCDLPAAFARYGFPAHLSDVKELKIKKDGLHAKAVCRHAAISNYIAFPTDERPWHLIADDRGNIELFFPSETVADDVDVIDIKKILEYFGSGDDPTCARELPLYPGIESGYLILKRNGPKYHQAVCWFVKEFLRLVIPQLA